MLPAGTTFVSAEDSAPAAPGAFTCSHAGGIVNCIGGTLPGGGAPRLIAIVVTAPNPTMVLTNQAFVDPDNTIPEGDELNNTDTARHHRGVGHQPEDHEGRARHVLAEQVTDYTIKVKNENRQRRPGRPPSASRCTTRCRSASSRWP